MVQCDLDDKMNEIELNKLFKNFYEIYEQIILTETAIEHFGGSFPEEWKLSLNRLKFNCLKFNLCEADDLENISDEDAVQVSEFCDDIKEKICYDFIGKISDE